jgi:pimeloyl-ACP methyl ester carboxylesterase
MYNISVDRQDAWCQPAPMRVHVRELGEGPPLLLINGLGANTSMWRPLERTLEGFRIVEFDLPGSGRSGVPWKPLSVGALARLATSVMDRLGIERADVLGYSMGGIVAQQLAADAPERVRRLVLVATSPGVGAMQGDLKAMLSFFSPLAFLSPERYAKTMGSLAGGRAGRDSAWMAEQGAASPDYAPSLRGYLGQMLTISVWSGLPLLSRIDHPVLVVAGDDDPLTPVANGMMLAHLLVDGRLLVLEGEGHLMLLDPDSPAHPAIHGFLAADRLDRALVWKAAAKVGAQDLERELAATGTQLPPWSIANALMRRRWLRSGPAVEAAG